MIQKGMQSSDDTHSLNNASADTVVHTHIFCTCKGGCRNRPGFYSYVSCVYALCGIVSQALLRLEQSSVRHGLDVLRNV